MLAINTWFDSDEGRTMRILHKGCTDIEKEAFSYLKIVGLPRSCFPVVGIYNGVFANKELLVGFELLFRHDQFSTPQGREKTPFVDLMQYAQTVADDYPGCRVFFHAGFNPSGKYVNRHQLVVMLPWEIKEEVAAVARLILTSTKNAFPFWDSRKGDAIERILI